MAKVVNINKNSGVSLTDQAYLEVKRMILSGEIVIGHHYLEPEIAKILGISRTPTREALVRLSQEGLIEIQPRRGVWVKPIRPKDIKEIYEILTSLEATAAYLAAKRRPSAEEIGKLSKTLDEMDAALDQDDLDAWAAADARFHIVLAELSNNERICSIVENYFEQVHRVRMLTLRLRPKPTVSNKDHRTVLEAISRGDAEVARDTHSLHRENSANLLLSLLDSYGLTQI